MVGSSPTLDYALSYLHMREYILCLLHIIFLCIFKALVSGFSGLAGPSFILIGTRLPGTSVLVNSFIFLRQEIVSSSVWAAVPDKTLLILVPKFLQLFCDAKDSSTLPASISFTLS